MSCILGRAHGVVWPLFFEDTSEAEVKTREGHDVHSPCHCSLDKEKSDGFCEHILIRVPTSLPEPESLKGKIFLTFRVFHLYYAG